CRVQRRRDTRPLASAGTGPRLRLLGHRPGTWERVRVSPMTESEWLLTTEPERMLDWWGGSGQASDRKLRLFAVACCRGIWHLLTDDRCRQAVEVAEQYADGLATAEAQDAAYRVAEGVHYNATYSDDPQYAGLDYTAAYAAACAAHPQATPWLAT